MKTHTLDEVQDKLIGKISLVRIPGHTIVNHTKTAYISGQYKGMRIRSFGLSGIEDINKYSIKIK